MLKRNRIDLLAHEVRESDILLVHIAPTGTSQKIGPVRKRVRGVINDSDETVTIFTDGGVRARYPRNANVSVLREPSHRPVSWV